MNPRNLLAIILAFVALTASSVIATTPSEASHGIDHHVYARITARLAADGQVEFALQQRLTGSTWSDRTFPRARYFPTTATVDQWLVSSTLTLPALDDPSSETDVRITARLRDNGQVEFALQQLADGAWSPRIFPRARYFPTTATVDQWLVSSTLSAALPLSAVDADRAALEAFYRSTGGQDWTVQTNWLSSRPTGEWYGVQTDINGRVISLDIDSNRLTGSIPPQLGNLAKLRWLSLSSNDLVGSIPPELGNLTALEALVLNFGNLTGSIPPELGSLTHLRFLEINDNSLTGSIPPQLGNLTKLWALRLNDNNLSGSIPPQLGDLVDLGRLRLRDNNLSGTIPPAVSIMIAHLVELTLDGNRFTGPVPPNRVPSGPDADRAVLEALYHATGGREWYDQINWLTERPLGEWAGVDTDSDGRVVTLDLNENNLAGSIPPELGNLTALERLDFGDGAGYPDRMRLSGPIPPELGNLAALKLLDLGSSELSGPIPPELGNLTALIDLFLWNNNLSGPIPPELGNLPALVVLDLATNSLSGSIPPELGNLSALGDLYLGANNLTGPIPPELGDLFALRGLWLGGNNLSGAIPPELANLDSLWDLDLGYNNLSGPIPPELDALILLLNELDFRGNDLTGVVPPVRWNRDPYGPPQRR